MRWRQPRDSLPSASRQAVDGDRLRVFTALFCFLFKASFGGFLEEYLGYLRWVQLSKVTLGENKVGRLGLFWWIWNSTLYFHLYQSIKLKFLFPFSLFISCLFLFLLFIPVDLVYVEFKCLAFMVISFLLVAVIHVRLDFLLQFMLISSCGYLRV